MVICLLGTLGVGRAQEESPGPDKDNLDSYLKSLSPQNPFKPLLPEKIIEPVIKEPPKPPESNSTPPRQIRTQQRNPSEDTSLETPPKIALPTLVITGVIWDSDRPQAIINGDVVNEGDTVAEIKIVAIRKTGIDIIYQGQAMTLTP